MTNPENIPFFTIIHHSPTGNSDRTPHQEAQGVLKFLLGEACGITHENSNNFQTMAKVTPEEFRTELSNMHM